MPGWFPKSGAPANNPPDSAPPSENDKASAIAAAQALAKEFGEHLRIRSELFGIEAREAGEVAARKGTLAVVAIVLLFFAYALLLVALIALLGRWVSSWSASLEGLGWAIVAIVVPSVWVENSPLVIHEAQQVRVPVVTAAAGGMQEYVRDEVNGLLFTHRDAGDLARAMQRLVSERL